jgi:hypothetical protein
MTYYVTMMDNIVQIDHDDQEIALLEAWLPSLSTKERAYIKGATKALLYAQGDEFPPDTDILRSCLWPQKESL